MYCGASKRGAQRGRSPDVLLIVLLYVVYKQKCQHSYQASLEVCNSQPGSTCSRLPSLLSLVRSLSFACFLPRLHSRILPLSIFLSLSLCILLPGINCTLQLPLLLLLLLFMLFCLYFILYFSMRFFFCMLSFLMRTRSHARSWLMLRLQHRARLAS